MYEITHWEWFSSDSNGVIGSLYYISATKFKYLNKNIFSSFLFTKNHCICP